ncbi:MAG: dihydroorotase, partial [Acidocella sp.]|nr:dihydroorotase [Acidocella sp.]
MSDLLFRNVRLIGEGIDQQGDLLVKNGLIVDFGPSLGNPDGAEIVEEDGAVLCPGLVDMRA